MADEFEKTKKIIQDTYGHLILNTRDIEQRLDLLPQFVPWPGTQLQVLAQVALDNSQSQALLLHLQEVLTAKVTARPGLHPGHDLAQTLITELLHLTQDTSAEEHLFQLESNCVATHKVVGTLV